MSDSMDVITDLTTARLHDDADDVAFLGFTRCTWDAARLSARLR